MAAPDSFLWAVGVEDTFITAPHPRTGRTLDEYELTGHYERWRADLALMAQLGVPCARYGVPWHRIQPAPNVWAWGFVDAALERMLALKIDPIVDLVHYGLPPWIERAFLNPDYPYYVAEYAARIAERFRGRVKWFTPLNEPRITAWYCGRLGWWPPYERSWRGFVALMLAICQGIVETVRALKQVDPDIVPFHVDATDVFDTDDPALAAETRRRQDIVFLALDLISGRVDRRHALWSWLVSEGAEEEVLQSFLHQPLDLPIIGVNLYPIFTSKRLLRDASGRLQNPNAARLGRARRQGRAHVFRTLRRAADDFGDGRQGRARAAAGLAAPVGRRRETVARRRRSHGWLYVVADVRARDLGLPPGPTAAARSSSADGFVGSRSRS
ncbi:family 1 glycosylhydrolase [Methylocystis sp. IM4]|uniref:family 1 glycosylhydrolase n=1 Tax=Methylocystis sp. IM4 TaxID=3136560 RepID=UPI003119A8FA